MRQACRARSTVRRSPTPSSSARASRSMDRSPPPTATTRRGRAVQSVRSESPRPGRGGRLDRRRRRHSRKERPERWRSCCPCRTNRSTGSLATVLQDQLRQLGVAVEVQILDRGTVLQHAPDREPDSYLFYYLWPVPIDVVTLFVGTATIPDPNWAQASIPEVDAAIEAWQNAANEEELAAAGAQFQLAVAETADHSVDQPKCLLGVALERPGISAAPVESLPLL